MALLGIDLGTSSVKTLLLDAEGRALSVSKADYAVMSPQPGWSESEPFAWWTATVSAVRSTLARAPREPVTAIGLSGQMHGIVLINAGQQPVRPALLWSDTRAVAELARYRALPAASLQRLANPLVPGMAGPLLCWLAEHEPSAYQSARRVLQPKDWLRLCLSDALATDWSDASATLLYDLPGDSWAEDVIAGLGIRRDLLPVILPSTAQAGTLSERAARELGLPSGLPIAAGAADTAAAALGTGLLAPGTVQLTLGTGAQIIQICSAPVPDPTLRTHLYRAADGANWYSMAAVQNAGLALDWVRQMFNASWEELYASAALQSPGSAGILFLPYLTRERPHHANAESTGAFLNLRIDHRRELLLHAALEGVAFGIREALETLPGSAQVTTLRLAGGGSKQLAWGQMLANILQRELVLVHTSDASARGAALIAGLASGVWPDPQAVATLSSAPGQSLLPDTRLSSTYDALYAAYLARSVPE